MRRTTRRRKNKPSDHVQKCMHIVESVEDSLNCLKRRRKLSDEEWALVCAAENELRILKDEIYQHEKGGRVTAAWAKFLGQAVRGIVTRYVIKLPWIAFTAIDGEQ